MREFFAEEKDWEETIVMYNNMYLGRVFQAERDSSILDEFTGYIDRIVVDMPTRSEGFGVVSVALKTGKSRRTWHLQDFIINSCR